MINYAELEPEVVPHYAQYVPVGNPPDTECNYLVMFFVGAVFFMALME
jgi:hypothetical protein